MSEHWATFKSWARSHFNACKWLDPCSAHTVLPRDLNTLSCHRRLDHTSTATQLGSHYPATQAGCLITLSCHTSRLHDQARLKPHHNAQYERSNSRSCSLHKNKCTKAQAKAQVQAQAQARAQGCTRPPPPHSSPWPPLTKLAHAAQRGRQPSLQLTAQSRTYITTAQLWPLT